MPVWVSAFSIRDWSDQLTFPSPSFPSWCPISAIESDVIKAPISVVWGLIRELDLTFTGAVASSEVENKESPSSVGSVRKVTYKNGTVQLIKLTELR